MSAVSSRSTRKSGRGRLGRAAAVGLGACLFLAALAGPASAKEVGSGGGGTTTACNPVASLTYKGDATTSDTGLGSITVSYGVKPCTTGQTVTVGVALYLTANPASIAYADPAAALSGRFTAFGVTRNTSYTATVTVRDAATGALVGTRSIFAAAISKGV